ncbi:hypothetical protein [Stutzerimonas nitrititolerans]|uniref:hypothetical protein n=1 Tax=Stutzerimonas nitrititolerans TaxID=2482751 RepID=UPI0028AAD7AC|nr:hypothetical protein [Stutzerimonas nitrititolerans]
MKRTWIAIVLSVSLSGCEMTEEMALSEAQKMIASTLKDAQSATFKGVFSTGSPGYGHICGYVNSKNSFGGYTGYQRFSANLKYSAEGSISVSDVQIEEGRLAEKGPDGKTYFDKPYWLERCDEGFIQAKNAQLESRRKSEQIAFGEAAARLPAVGAISRPARSEVVTSDSPGINAKVNGKVTIGEKVTVLEVKDGFVRIGDDRWIIPDLLDWNNHG